MWRIGKKVTNPVIPFATVLQGPPCPGQDTQKEQNGYRAVYMEKRNIHPLQAIRPDYFVFGNEQDAYETKKYQIYSSEVEREKKEQQEDESQNV